MPRPILHKLLPVLLATLLSGVAAQAGSVNFTATATVLSKNNCRFFTPAATLDFGTLDPTSPANVTASTTFNFRCQGADPVATFAITRNDGLHTAGPGLPRMQNGSDATSFIPYTLALSPLTGTVPKNVMQVLTVTGTLLGTDYQLATAGTYTDLVVVSINP